VNKVVTPEEMGRADQAAIAAGVPSLVLMERAGRAVAMTARRLAAGVYGRRIVVVCGKGNNAGDGFVAARYLARWGAAPVVVLLGDPDGLRGDARTSFERLRGVPTVPSAALGRALHGAAAVVDAIVGTGFRGALEGSLAEAVERVNASGLPVVAVDIPSGVEGGTGRVEGPAIRARTTVTMAALKTGLLLPPGCEHAGVVEVADIGIAGEHIAAGMSVPADADVTALLPPRPLTAHKRSVGTVLVVAGSVGMSGAAALASGAALRAGAGLVTIATASSVALEVDQTVLEATTLPLPETPRGSIGSAAADAILERASGLDVVALGPGLTTDPGTVQLVRKVVGELDKPLVLDADGINAVAPVEGVLRPGRCTILTPHAGELARLLGTSSKEISADRIGAARSAAERTGAVVLLKGFPTVVAEPGGRTVLVPRGGPALATGGTGDVLTGVVAALLASGIEPSAAAWAGAWIHGAAGDVAAAQRGVRAVVAGDLLDALAEVVDRLEQR
jgi:ADP-dependent NAD(P)H-hydrate dehydratase / NAD(P)H-hydrate epimerase